MRDIAFGVHLASEARQGERSPLHRAVFSPELHVLLGRNLVHRALLLLGVGANLEVLAALDRLLRDALALGALQLEHDLLRGLRLLVEDGLGLTAETTLLAVVTTLACGTREGGGGSVSGRSGGEPGGRGERR